MLALAPKARLKAVVVGHCPDSGVWNGEHAAQPML
ncbi:hypothetical protein IL54_1513 [Sphingobium sp. ba1]|nr:hypothetical protein IL54_1513 [Sphingobium sp. ba1]